MPTSKASEYRFLPDSAFTAEAKAYNDIARSLAGRTRHEYELATGKNPFPTEAAASPLNPDARLGHNHSGPPWGSAFLHPVAWVGGKKDSAGNIQGTRQVATILPGLTVSVRNWVVLVRPFAPLPGPAVAPYSRLYLHLIAHLAFAGSSNLLISVRARPLNGPTGPKRSFTRAITSTSETAHALTPAVASTMWLSMVSGYNTVDIDFKNTGSAQTILVDALVLAQMVKRSHITFSYDAPFIDLTMTLWLDWSVDSTITYPALPSLAASRIANKAADITPVDDLTAVGATGFTSIPAAVNGLQVGRFNGSGDALVSDGWLLSDIISASAHRIFVVLKVNAYPAAPPAGQLNDIIIGDTNLQWGLGLNAAGTLYAHNFDGSDDVTAGTPISLGVWHLVEFWHSAGVIGAVCDGVEVTTASGDLSLVAQTMAIGKNTFSTRWLSADVGEVIAYNVELSTTNAATTRAYLKTQWGIP